MMPRAPRVPVADRIAVLLWLAVVAVSLAIYRDSIATLDLRDADDYLRLAQVRDLMAGQSWFDITQYRINPADGGGMMHWSRFIDVQIAALIWLFGLFLSPEAAERWAVALYPPLLVLPLLLLMRRVLDRLGDRRQMIAGLFLTATGVTFLHYFAPLRIDHHNWQLVLSVAMLWLALGEPTFRRGLAAALVMAAHVEISLEGFPYLAIFGALFSLEWLRNPAAERRLEGLAAGLIVFPALWLLIFRGRDSFRAVHCDSFSLPYATGVAAAALVLLVGFRLPGFTRCWQRRALLLAIAGAAGAGAFLIFGRPCLDGPFGDLEPLVRSYWYDMVMEGRPIWRQRGGVAAFFLTPTLVGIGAAFWAWRRARDTQRAADWHRMLFVLPCSAVLSLLVLRTSAAAHAYLIPVFAAMGVALWDWSRARRSALARVGGAMVALTAIPAVDVMLVDKALGAISPENAAILNADKATEAEKGCPSSSALAAFAREPAALAFAPLDIGPSILVGTPHSVVATGHHRNHVAMNRVITAFLSDPAAARPIVQDSGARWLVLCTRLPEIRNFARGMPRSLAARLARGEDIPWLTYEAGLSHSTFRVYRILR